MTNSLEMVKSFREKAQESLDAAELAFKNCLYDKSISASQDCIEFSMKAIFFLLTGEGTSQKAYLHGERGEAPPRQSA